MSNSLDFLWYDYSFVNNSLLFESALNWDASADLFLMDIPGFSFLFSVNFISNFIYTDIVAKISFVDVFFLGYLNPAHVSFVLFNAFVLDIFTLLSMQAPFLSMLYVSEFQDLTILSLYLSPELIIAFRDYYFFIWGDLEFDKSIAALTDLYSDSLTFSLFEFLEFIVLNSFFFMTALLVLFVLRISKWTHGPEAFLPKYAFYLYSMAREIRFQFDAMLWLFGVVFLYSFFAIMTFDDDKEENIEMLSSFWFSLFLGLIGFLVYRYSYHYFSFLEISISEGKTVSFIAKQFFRDFVNTFALLLRFFILVFRLNVYDGLDDLYDSYYFFVGDYDEDEYFDEFFFSLMSVLFYDSDNNEDHSFLLEEEHDWSYNLFHLVFVVWGKFFFFLFFLLEELMRVALALYIIYLIIFDVHAVNCSYVEDTYFAKKKTNEYGSLGVVSISAFASSKSRNKK